jgi:O-antigen/teichoic acid export membrane protein
LKQSNRPVVLLDDGDNLDGLRRRETRRRRAALTDLPLWAAGLTIGGGGTALFGIAQRLASLLQLPSAAVAAVLTPHAAALLARGQYTDLEGRLRRGAALGAVGSAAGFAVLIFGSHTLLRLVYGPYFEQAGQAVIVLGLAQLINAAAGFGGLTLQMMNESRRLLVLSAISAAILAALVWPLASAFGLPGLAWAWLAMVVVQNALTIHAVRRLTGMRVYTAIP